MRSMEQKTKPVEPMSAEDAGVILAHLQRVVQYREQISELAAEASDPAAFLEAAKGFVAHAEGSEFVGAA